MKNSFSKILNTIISLLLLSVSFSSSLTLSGSDIDKFKIENSLNDKVTNLISNFGYNNSQFAVTSNVSLLHSGSASNGSVTSSFGALELEGILPAVPQKTKDGVISKENDYKIQIQDITVWLDYELDVINAQQNIKKFLFESIDWLADCDNCLKFRSKAFPAGASNNSSVSTTPNMGNTNNLATEDDIRILEDNIAYLTEQIEKYENNDSTEKDRLWIDFLNRELQEQKELNAELSAQILKNAQSIITRDSSIIKDLTSIPETAINGNNELVKTFADNIEKVNDTQSKTNYFLMAVVFILITLYSILMFLNKGPKTVYLKPKGNNNADTSDVDDADQGVKSATNLGTTTANNTIEADVTKAYEDDSVIQSDLKTIKQSAVKMSVGQKQEASQILKDWLDEGNSEQTDNNDTDEESN